MGGMHGFGAVVTPGSDAVSHEEWELRVFALSTLVGTERLGAGSGRAIREEMDPAEYLRAGYYERWLWSTEQRLLRSGTIGRGRGRRLDRAPARGRGGAPARGSRRGRAVRRGDRREPPRSPRRPMRGSAPGDAVRVRRMRPEGHTRCPRYARGATGVVEAVRGLDAFPDIGPYAGPDEPVYAVAFSSDDLFGPSPEGRWTVLLDLFDSYLEPA